MLTFICNTHVTQSAALTSYTCTLCITCNVEILVVSRGTLRKLFSSSFIAETSQVTSVHLRTIFFSYAASFCLMFSVSGQIDTEFCQSEKLKLMESVLGFLFYYLVMLFVNKLTNVPFVEHIPQSLLSSFLHFCFPCLSTSQLILLIYIDRTPWTIFGGTFINSSKVKVVYIRCFCYEVDMSMYYWFKANSVLTM